MKVRLVSVICAALIAFAGSSLAQNTPQDGETVLHTFKVWSLLPSTTEKLDFYWGFTNGFFFGPRSPKFLSLMDCIEAHIKSDQAIAMIDKYYIDNPQRWGMPIWQEIVSALIVKDGPCPGKDPWVK